ncbi:tRNA pseudouridine(13) synthase TruD [Phycisphaera mikurensis]|nr:tRNA pseudouridine(13) synthase TruD [Phycisphaera mikurensis]
MLTADLPGTGGVLKERPEDFTVDEQPLYEPSGAGEHLYLFVEKREATTAQAIKAVAKAFRVPQRAIGHAGLKDKHAVTRQHLSVWLPGPPDPTAEEACIARVNHHPKLHVHWAERHGNKLRRGHHGGNRFGIKIRGVGPAAVLRARPILDRIAERGLPNAVGPQRFGFRGNAHTLGKLLLQNDPDAFLAELLGVDGVQENPRLTAARAAYRRGDLVAAIEGWPKSLPHERQALDNLRQGHTPERAVRALARTQRDFLASALQSAVFNRVLARRLNAGTWDRLIDGDLAWKHENRATFPVDAAVAATENAEGGRVGGFAVSPSGPLPGPDCQPAEREALAVEDAALAELDLERSLFDGGTPLADAGGARRPLRVPVGDVTYAAGGDEHGPYLSVSFELGRGVYATAVMAEVMKNAEPGGESGVAAQLSQPA